MRLLRINNINVDIDEETAIGIDVQTYDIKEPAKAKVNVSNSFSVPKTINNLLIFGLPDNPQSTSTKIYEAAVCDYWVDNEKLIDQSKARVESIDNRINLFIYNKQDIWDTLKTVYWPDFLKDLMQWLYDEKGLYNIFSKFTGTFADFIDEFANATEGVKLSMFYGNLYAQELVEFPGQYVERDTYDVLGDVDLSVIYLYSRYFDPSTSSDFEDLRLSHGGHFSMFVKTIFEYIEETYDVNFLTSGGVLPGNIWDDPVASQLYVNCKEIGVIATDAGGGNIDAYFYKIGGFIDESEKFLPYKNIYDKRDKTVFDFVASFFQHMNIIKDELFINGGHVIRLARFDDLETLAEVVDFSGGISPGTVFKPFVDGYAQNNYIKFKNIYPDGNELANSKNITCSNVNLEVNADLISIDAYVPAAIPSGNDFYLDLSTSDAFKSFVFMLDNGIMDHNALVIWYDVSFLSTSTSVALPVAALYDLSSEYNFLSDIITYPKFYELKKWLTVSDIRNIEFFKQYYIKELNGSFFLNKIKGFNPEKSKEPTTIELIKVSNRTPVTPPDLDYFVDGVGDAYTDGINDYYY